MQRLKAQQAEEQKLIDLIRHGIAGEPENPSPAVARMDSINHDKIVTEAAKEALQEESAPMSAEELKLKEQKKLKKKRYLENKKRKWYQTKVNNYVYIQGLPNDVTETELKEYFVRCGVIRLDPVTGKE